MRITVDYDRCSGHGMCETEAPELFEVQDDLSLEVLDDHPTGDQEQAARAACEACPTGALSLVAE